MFHRPSSRSPGRRRRWPLALAYAALVASCESPFAPDVVRPGHVEISPAVLQMVVGGTTNLTARVFDESDGLMPAAKVFWSTQNPAVVTVSQAGVVTAVGPGTAQIAASSGGQSSTIAVTVEQRPIALIRVTPSAGSVIVGQSLPLVGEALDASSNVLPNRPLAWETDNAAVATVSSAGLVSGVSVGVATISASGEGKTGTSVVTVIPAPVASISVTPDGGTINVGSSLQLTGTPRDAAGQALTGRPLTWQSNAEAVATVTSNGLVTAITPGTASITVSAQGAGAGGSTPTTSVQVTVRLAPVASAVIIPSPATLQVGQGLSFAVNLFDAGGAPLSTAGRTISWSSAQPAIATVSDAGVASGVAVGVATLTMTVTTPGHATPLQVPVQLTVINQPVTSVTVLPTPATVHAGPAYARTFTATPRDAGGQPLTGRTVVWTSSNQAVAVVDAATGVVTGIAPGSVQIRATSEGVEGTAAVTVDLVPVATVTMTPPAANLTPPQTVQVTAVPRDSAGNAITGSALGGRGTTWATSNALAATVDGAGLVTAIAQGAATVTATIGGTVGQSTVAVGAIPIATITVTPSPQSVTVGGTLQLTATARDAGNNVLSGRSFTWASSNAGLAPVDQTGLVTALAVGGPVSITASAEGKTGTALVTVLPRPATHLAMATEPAAVAQSGIALTQQPAVRLLDAVNAPVAQPGVTVTAAIASGSGTLGGTLTAVTDGNGVATFADLAVSGPAGPYTLAFTAPSLAGVTSGTIVLGAGGASKLAVSVQPSAASQNAVVFAQQPSVALRDGSNNPVALAGVMVTASIASGSGTLGGTVTVSTDATGTATFTDLSITGLAGDFTLAFGAAGLTPATSGTITLGVGAAAALAVAVEPSATAINGTALATQPQVRVTDSGGNPVAVAGTLITAALVEAGATLGGTLAVATDAAGLAVFTDLVITGTAASYTIQFTAPAHTAVTSAAIALGAGAATQLTISTQPSPAPQNAIAFAVQPAIQLRDASGNAVAQAGVLVQAAITPPGTGTLGGTLTAITDLAGLATFTDLSLTGLVGIRTIDFTSAPLTGVTSANVDLQPGVATQLALSTPPPANATSGEVFLTAPVVQLRDVSGNDVAQASVTVTAVIASGSGATLSGGSAVTSASGAATFSTIALTGTAGAFTLQFASGTLTPVTSGTITLAAGTGSKLAISTAPSSSVQNAVAFPVQPAIQLQDASNNPVPLAGVEVFAVIASGGGSLGGTASAITNAAGLATFTDLSITGATGNRTLLFTAAGYLPVSSGAIAVGVGAPTAVTISTAPSASVQSGIAFPQQPVILVRDVSSNPIPGVVVTAAIATGAGTLGGTLTATTNAAGLATFTDLVITGATGNRTLSFTIPGPLSATSGTVAVGPGTPTSLTLSTQPSATVANDAVFAVQPVLQLSDGSGNGVPGVVITASVATGAGVLGGTLTATTDANGAATFTNLRITGAVGARTLGFSGAALSATSSTVTVGVGAATSLAITQEPSATVANNAIFGTQPSVQVTDVSANPVSGVVVTASIATGAGTLGGTLTATTDGSGVATFTNLRITGVTGARTLQLAGASLAAISTTITVTPGTVTQLVLTTAPSSSVQNAVVFPVQPVVQLRDISGNDVPTAGTVVTATIATGGGVLGGTSAIATSAAGTASFTDLRITGSTGDRTLSFGITVPSVISVTSGTIAVTTGTPTSLTITTQPSAAATNDVVFTQQPVVLVTDVSGNPVSAVGVTASIATGAGALGGTLVATTIGDGSATFTNLRITGATGARTLQFSGASLSATSNAVTVSAGAATSLQVTTQPPATVANDAAFVPQPAVTATDVSGNPVSGVVVTASIASGAGTLGGTATATTNASGVATWTDLKITGTVGSRTLGFGGASLNATSSSISVTPGAVTQLALTTAPSAAVTSGVAFAQQPVVQLRDVSGNDVPTAGTTVTASVASGAGTLGGTLAQATDVTGAATFTNLVLTGATGARTLGFAIAVPSAISVTSGTVTVSAGAAASLTVSTQPSATVANDAAFAQQPAVLVTDASANPIAGIVVTAAIASGGGSLGGTATATTNASGIATWTNLKITGTIGNRTLSFTGASLNATSNTITVTAGAVTQVALTTAPSASVSSGTAFPQQPVVQLRDVSGNNVPTAGTTVTASIASGGGSLGGTAAVATDGTGAATFTDLVITGTVGNRTLQFAITVPSSLSVTSGTVAVGAGTPSSLTVSTQPSASVANGAVFGQQPAVFVTDASSNPVAGVVVTAAIASGGGTLGGTATATTNASGIATWTDLVITGTIGDRTLSFSAASLSANSNTITVTFGAATQLTITTQPSASASSGSPFAQQPVIQLRDVSGNAVAQAGVGITATIETGTGTLGTTTTVNTIADGTATFGDLAITGTGTFTLRFASGALASVISNNVVIP